MSKRGTLRAQAGLFGEPACVTSPITGMDADIDQPAYNSPLPTPELVHYDGSVHACSGCGKHAFPKPTLCYWCQRSSST